MLNIEIHGMYPVQKDNIAFGLMQANGNAKDLRDRIFKLFITKGYLINIAVTIVIDNAQNYQGKEMPFLRVVSAPSEHLDEVMEVLKILKMNIEVNILTAFYQNERGTQ